MRRVPRFLSSTAERLLAVLLAVIFLVAYRNNRDTIKLEANLTQSEVGMIVDGIQEWSAPKFFRYIKIKPTHDGYMAAWVREDRNRWSVTTFTHQGGAWRKVSWFLMEEDRDRLTN